MNKKIIIIAILFIILSSGIQSCLAAEEANTKNVELNVKGETTIKEGSKTVEFILAFGKFTQVEENVPFGYEGKLEYDKDMFESVTVEGLNKWTAEYNADNNNLVGDIAKVTANTDITKITFNLKNDIVPGATGKIKLHNFLVTNETDDFTFNKEITITMEKKQIQEIEKEPEPEKVDSDSNKKDVEKINNQEEKITKTVNNQKKSDTTIVSKNIPKTGNSNIMISMLIVAFSIGGVSLFHYKKIKLK